MQIYYRISNGSYKKEKLPGADKLACLNNFQNVFQNKNMTIIADNCHVSLLNELKGMDFCIEETNLGNSGSFLHVLNMACELPDDEIVYFVEDDYLHRQPAENLIAEGFQRADYVTLYDHPDKYGPMYGNGELSKVFRTASTHWRYTISTCMTFASQVKTLKKDKDIFHKLTYGYSHPQDHLIFTELKRIRSRNLAVCIPGTACHIDLTLSLDMKKCLIDEWAMDIVIEQYKNRLLQIDENLQKTILESENRMRKFQFLFYLNALESFVQKNKAAGY